VTVAVSLLAMPHHHHCQAVELQHCHVVELHAFYATWGPETTLEACDVEAPVVVALWAAVPAAAFAVVLQLVVEQVVVLAGSFVVVLLVHKAMFDRLLRPSAAYLGGA
jgi:hypothetical protein